MIVCKNCGHQNGDSDTFCGSCGKFLEWTGERVAIVEPEPEPEPAPPAPAPESAHHGFMDRVKQAVGIDESGPQAPSAAPVPPAAAPPPPSATQPVAGYTPAQVVASATGQPPAPPAPPPQAPPAPAARPVPLTSATPPPTATRPTPYAPPSYPQAAPPPPAASSTTAEPALAGVGAASAAPGYEEPASRRPVSVAPTVARPRPAPRTAEPPTRRRPGDLICGQCGEGNDPTRHFCRRCGNTLDEAVAIQLPWYRRLWNRLFNRTYAAGYRHRRVGPPNVMAGFWRIVRLALAAIIVLFVLGFALVPSFRTSVVNRVQAVVNPLRVQFFPRLDSVHATGASASTAIAGHLPTLAIDGFNNTYWAASPRDKAPFLKLTFASPTDLADIGITPGASGTAPTDNYLAQPRPHDVHLVFSDGTTQELNIADNQKAQFFPINVKQVTYVEIYVLSTWAPNPGPNISSVAITEVEFRIKD